MENWRCPTCDSRLVQRGRVVPTGGGARIDGSPFPAFCPVGHPPVGSSDELHAYRDSRGYQQNDASLREMPEPPGAW